MNKATSIEQLSGVVQAVGEQLNKNLLKVKDTLLDKETFESDINAGSVKSADIANALKGSESALYPSYYGKNSIGEVGFHSFIGESEQIKNNFSTNILEAKSGDVRLIDLVNKDIYCSSVIQSYKFIETDDDITLSKQFDNSDSTNFINEPHVTFDEGKCSLKKVYDYPSEIQLDGYYYTELFNLLSFEDLEDVDLYTVKNNTSSYENIIVNSIAKGDTNISISGTLDSLITEPMVDDYCTTTYSSNGQFILNLESKVYVSKVRIYNRPDIQYASTSPNRVIIYTQDTDGTWVVATDRSGIGHAEYIDISVNKLCDKLKIYTVSSSDSSNTIRLRAIRVLGVKCKYLLQQEDGTYYSIHESNYNSETKRYNEVQLTEFASDNISFDIKDLMTSVTIGEETFRPIDKFSKVKIVFNTDVSFRIHGIIATKQLVIGSRSFSMKLARDIVKFQPTYTTSNGGTIRVVCSNNDGISWYTHNGTGWIELTNTCPLKAYDQLTTEELTQLGLFKTEAYESGLDIQSLTSVDFDLINNNKTMRFAYVLGVETYSSVCSMSKLDFIFKAKGTFVQMAPTEIKIQLGEDFIAVTPLADFDFVKINVGISDKFATIVEVDVSTDDEVNNEIINLKDRLTM